MKHFAMQVDEFNISIKNKKYKQWLVNNIFVEVKCVFSDIELFKKYKNLIIFPKVKESSRPLILEKETDIVSSEFIPRKFIF